MRAFTAISLGLPAFAAAASFVVPSYWLTLSIYIGIAALVCVVVVANASGPVVSVIVLVWGARARMLAAARVLVAHAEADAAVARGAAASGSTCVALYLAALGAERSKRVRTDLGDAHERRPASRSTSSFSPTSASLSVVPDA